MQILTERRNECSPFRVQVSSPQCGLTKAAAVGWTEALEQSGSGRKWLNALLPAGRIDRKIEFPLPDEKTKKRIFQIHTSRMTLADDVTLDDLIMAKDDLSGADIKVSGLWKFGLLEGLRTLGVAGRL